MESDHSKASTSIIRCSLRKTVADRRIPLARSDIDPLAIPSER
jgi:hypothetical protein